MSKKEQGGFFLYEEESGVPSWVRKATLSIAVVVVILALAAAGVYKWVDGKQSQIQSSELNAGINQPVDVMVPYEPNTQQETSEPETSEPSTPDSSTGSSTTTPNGTLLPVPSSKTPTRTPTKTAGTENILVIGTDSRKGTKTGIGGDTVGEGHADVMMLVHLPSDRGSATVVSIPRDTMTPLPSCRKADGSGITAAEDMGQINKTLADGGPGCTVATVERMSGVKITHFAVITFDAAVALSNAVGGVPVDVKEPIQDDKTGLKLAPGQHTLKGKEALAYVRTRYGIGDGSDLGRIKNQHQFLQGLANKLLSAGTLSNPAKLSNIADALTKNLTVDEGLNSITKLINLGESLQGLNPDTLKFTTLPVKYWEVDPNRVVPKPVEAERMWTLLR